MIFLTKNNKIETQTWLESAPVEGSAVLIDKSKNWTSFDVVAKLRTLTKIKKIGHTGTLDPLATGLLIVCLGRATKRINEFEADKKSYFATIKLGAKTKSYDSETEEEDITDIDFLNESDIVSAVNKFKGKILQNPPAYSAKWINGKRMYNLARQNQEFEIKPVEVEIHKNEIIKIELPFVFLNIECSKGTYIRSIAHDLGEILGCGAYLKELRRTYVGDYSVEDAFTIQEMQEKLKLN